MPLETREFFPFSLLGHWLLFCARFADIMHTKGFGHSMPRGRRRGAPVVFSCLLSCQDSFIYLGKDKTARNRATEGGFTGRGVPDSICRFEQAFREMVWSDTCESVCLQVNFDILTKISFLAESRVFSLSYITSLSLFPPLPTRFLSPTPRLSSTSNPRTQNWYSNKTRCSTPSRGRDHTSSS